MEKFTRIVSYYVRPLILFTSKTLLISAVVAAQAFASGVELKPGDIVITAMSGYGATWTNRVEHFSVNGTLLDVFDFGPSNDVLMGMGFDASDNFYIILQGDGIIKISKSGDLMGIFGSGYSIPASILFNNEGDVYVGEDGLTSTSSAPIIKLDQSGMLLANYTVMQDPSSGFGVDYMSFAADQCTLQYTSEGFSIQQFNVCTNKQLPDLVTSIPEPPLAQASPPIELLYSIKHLQNGDILVGTWDTIFLMDTSGQVIKNYTLPGPNPYGWSPESIALEPGDKAFVALDWLTGNVYQINIQTGEVDLLFNALNGTSDDLDLNIAVVPAGASDGLTITASHPFIPSKSRVLNGKVLTRSQLKLELMAGGRPIPDAVLSLQSDRGAVDKVIGPLTKTDSFGTTSAQVQTRSQVGSSVVTSATTDVPTTSPAKIDWLPARFEHTFLVTCYVVSNEADFLGTPLISNIPGLPSQNRYHRGFIKDIEMQGSGLALNGSYIRYDAGRYSFEPCPLTSIAACAADGRTLAVDKGVIPRLSTVSIDGDGDYVAQDGGGWINGYHVDEYYGLRRKACLAAAKRYRLITFDSY